MALTQEQKEAFKREKAEREQYWIDREQQRKQDLLDRSKQPRDYDNQIKCPVCDSTQITAGNKGFGLGKAAAGGILLGPVGLLGGLIGSKKIIVTCLNCGNQWKPGE